MRSCATTSMCCLLAFASGLVLCLTSDRGFFQTAGTRWRPVLYRKPGANALRLILAYQFDKALIREPRLLFCSEGVGSDPNPLKRILESRYYFFLKVNST